MSGKSDFMKLAIMVLFGTLAVVTLFGLVGAAILFEIVKEDMEKFI